MKTKIFKGLSIVAVLLYISSCTKTVDSDSGSGSNNGGGGNNGGTTTTTITYVNNSFTPVSLTVNNQTQVINAGANAVVSGTPGSALTGSAYTSGQTTSGTQVGLKLIWTINDNFPSSGNYTDNINVGANYFYLRIINNDSYYPMNEIFVNYGLQAQTEDNITIPNNGLTYNVGYYSAYSNSNVQAENGTISWFWATLNLTGTINQSITITGN